MMFTCPKAKDGSPEKIEEIPLSIFPLFVGDPEPPVIELGTICEDWRLCPPDRIGECIRHPFMLPETFRVAQLYERKIASHPTENSCLTFVVSCPKDNVFVIVSVYESQSRASEREIDALAVSALLSYLRGTPVETERRSDGSVVLGVRSFFKNSLLIPSNRLLNAALAKKPFVVMLN